MDTDTIYGYQFVAHAKYKALKQPPPGFIMSAAVITCAQCGTIIAGMGGPRSSCYCKKCFDQKKFEAFTRGTLLEEVIDA